MTGLRSFGDLIRIEHSRIDSAKRLDEVTLGTGVTPEPDDPILRKQRESEECDNQVSGLETKLRHARLTLPKGVDAIKERGSILTQIKATLEQARQTGHEAEQSLGEEVLKPDASWADAVSTAGVADEPWLTFTDRDYFGMALSGGGIRSATYNLGLLQALEEQGVLAHVDYLSTVSGGGYIGGFWTAWRQHHSREVDADNSERLVAFPRMPEKTTADEGALAPVRDIREAPQIRHLREFSRFLMPRAGLQHAETWAGVVAILGGMLPSLCATLALLGAALYLWFGATFFLAWVPVGSGWLAAGVFAVLTFGLHYFMEQGWRRQSKGARDIGSAGFYRLFALAIAIFAGVSFWFWREVWQPGVHHQWVQALRAAWSCESLSNGTCVVLYPTYTHGHVFESVPFGASVIWAATALALLLLRDMSLRIIQDKNKLVCWSSAFERATARMLAPALATAALALVWETAHWLLHKDRSLRLTASGGVGLAALFAWVRGWLAKPVTQTWGSALMGRLVPWLKPLVPQLIANAAFICILTGVALLMQSCGLGRYWYIGACGSLLVLLVTMLAFDPARIGLHDFYRSRIARCYLGAARAAENAAVDRATNEQLEDDLTLDEAGLNAQQPRPIHLVCCAANDLAGDVLGSLYRGARSAVISPIGISIGNNWAPPSPDLRLSSALTASAAAFNSQMGSLSMRLGPSVAFLMSALNLRLGLWVPHPLIQSAERYDWIPGRHFFLEMLGQTQCVTAETADQLGYMARSIHLSDGAHFENLGLYELVRRHCRYLVVSDCGADPDFTFDDLGNAARRIREDFGVEIELDTAPLRPNADRHCRQHAVVGTIHYDGVAGTDKGMIIYFKPALTGDEPPDVLEYQIQSPGFPHETTGDQFYDEAQWESYRRLGEHAVHAALRRVGNAACTANPVDRLFLDASQRWHPRPERHDEVLLDLSERLAQLESDIRKDASLTLRSEFFPEVQEAQGTLVQASDLLHEASPSLSGATAPTVPLSQDDIESTLHFLVLVLQLMEDVWIAAELDVYWSHPLNEGWMNYFQRWASTPTLRRWWPILRPLHCVGFRDFVRDRFELRLNELARGEHGPGAILELLPPAPTDRMDTDIALDPTHLNGLAWDQWLRRYGQPITHDKQAFTYQLTLDDDGRDQLTPIQVGFLLFTMRPVKGSPYDLVEWYASELFVPHALNGAGIVARFLDAAIARFKQMGNISEMRVHLDDNAPTNGLPHQPPDSSRRDPGSRRARVNIIGFYKSRGFVYLRESTDTGVPRTLKLDLGISPDK